MNIKLLCVLTLGISPVLLSGCSTTRLFPRLPGSEVKKDEVVLLTLRAREPNEPDIPVLSRGFGLDELKDLLANSAYILQNEAQKYRAAYEAQSLNTYAIALNEKTNKLGQAVVEKRIDQVATLERIAEGKRAMILVVDFLPLEVEGASASYFQIQPRALVCYAAKAKMTRRFINWLKADRINVLVTVKATFPDSRQPEGKAEYSHVFEIPDVKLGDKRSFVQGDRRKFTSIPFEVPSEGPMLVSVSVVEYNELETKMTALAKKIKKFGD